MQHCRFYGDGELADNPRALGYLYSFDQDMEWAAGEGLWGEVLLDSRAHYTLFGSCPLKALRGGARRAA